MRKTTKYDLVFDEDRMETLKMVSEYDEYRICSPEGTADMINEIFNLENRPEEMSVLVALDCSKSARAVFELSNGTARNCLMNGREIFIRLLMVNAASFIVAHNHPSGNPSPSKCDINVFRKLHESANMLGIPLVDFIIIGNGCFTSFVQKGLMD